MLIQDALWYSSLARHDAASVRDGVQKLQELEDCMAGMQHQRDSSEQQVVNTTATLRSVIMALLANSRDLLAFYSKRGYETPEGITAVLNKLAASASAIAHVAGSDAENGLPFASPEVSQTDPRVLDWVAAASSASCTSPGAPAMQSLPHKCACPQALHITLNT